MQNNQIKLLTTLAKKINAEEKVRDNVVVSLQSAKIITKSGNFTKHYSNLNKVVALHTKNV